MLTKNLKVKIPKKFKKQLIARFSVSNVKVQSFASYYNVLESRYIINIPCPLCEVYKEGDSDCMLSCPFSNFVTLGSGCLCWIRKIVGILHAINFEEKELSWTLENNKQARKFLKKLKTQAKKYIEWV